MTLIRQTSLAFLVVLSGARAVDAASTPSPMISDEQVSAEVRALLQQHSALMVEPVPIYVQTVDRIVYLRGIVDTGLERSMAGSIARQAPDALKVVNDITVQR